ncbi:MAG: DNA polymerase III subunit gamma/tau [Rhodospirillales bacterium]|nr:DNA polymerase III subunit gamma/tau [Rhodospirillales bacterium]
MNDALEPASQTTETPVAADSEYQVLARTYRPQTFADLIGQEAMVRTLTNAFDSGRLAHAFILTGVRGVGKTTTARIIARAFNCVGPDGNGGPTITPCGTCDFCTSIAEDRLVDVMEMDAASRTGVDDIRELIEGVRYRPVSARYKVYIIDEVHMLSRNAFNALLKTLEEPPKHVKFIFATTEIRKVPVTVLSRCQRFDLRRVDVETLTRHFTKIAEQEQARLSEGAISLIARAADGSVRDGLSLLDQAVAVGAGANTKSSTELGEDDVRAMLGLADREASFDLFERVMAGDVAGALEKLDADYADGADPLILLQDLLDVVHWLTRIKVSPAVLDEPGTAEIDRLRGADLNQRLSMAVLTRAWQMLLKGVAEVQAAPSPIQAAEMILIRLAYMADLPSPADAVKALQSAGQSQAPAQSGAAAGSPAPAPVPSSGGAAVSQAVPASAPRPQAEAAATPVPQSFNDIIQLADACNERILKTELETEVHLVSFQAGAIEIRLRAAAANDLSSRLSAFLREQTGERWMVTLAREGGAETLREQADSAARDMRDEVERHPVVRAVMETFPGAEIEAVRGFDAGDIPEVDDPGADQPGAGEQGELD